MAFSGKYVGPVLLVVAVLLASCSERPQSLADYIAALCMKPFRSAAPDEAPFLADNLGAMTKMMIDMGIRPSGDVDTDFVAKLCDVYPDGRSILVVDGIANVRKRNGLDKDDLIVPGSVYQIDIDCWSTAYQFNSGHQIQLIISSSNAPKYQPCPNTGAPLARVYSSFCDANNTIFIGGSHASSIILPVASS